MIQTCPNNHLQHFPHTPFLINMAPKPAASATAKPTTSATPASSRPSTPIPAAKSLALADEEVYDEAETNKLLNGLAANHKADLEACM